MQLHKNMLSEKTAAHKARVLSELKSSLLLEINQSTLTEDFSRFLDLFYQNVSVEDLEETPIPVLTSITQSIWKLLQTHKGAGPHLRVYNPKPTKQFLRQTVVEIVHPNMPFIVDSLIAVLNRQRLTVSQLIHPVIALRRSRTGRLEHIDGNPLHHPNVPQESIIYLETGERLSEEALSLLEQEILTTLSDVRACVQDWLPMRHKLLECLLPADSKIAHAEELNAFIKWAEAGHFTLLGYREFGFDMNKTGDVAKIRDEAHLGILKNATTDPLAEVRDVLEHQWRSTPLSECENPISITKTILPARVHRPTPMDVIRIKKISSDQRVIGESQFFGLFTSTAYNQSVKEIPLIRLKLAKTLAYAGLQPDWHDGKTLLHIFETFPRDELFQLNEEELLSRVMSVLQLQERQQLRLLVRRDPLGHFYSCIVYVPKDRYSPDLRRKIGTVLEENLQSSLTNYNVQLGDLAFARVQYILNSDPQNLLLLDEHKIRQLEDTLAQLSLSWTDHLHQSFMTHFGEEKGRPQFIQYQNVFPQNYQATFPVEIALEDCPYIERALKDSVCVQMRQNLEKGTEYLTIKIYTASQPLTLSEALPILENMGIRAITETPFELTLPEGHTVWIHAIEGILKRPLKIDLTTITPLFCEAVESVIKGKTESDEFNQLTLYAGISWRETLILRTYRKYLLQVGFPFSSAYTAECFLKHTAITRAILDVFLDRLNPKQTSAIRAHQRKALRYLSTHFDAVVSVDEDKILRRFLNLILSTLRTNYFQKTDQGQWHDYLSIKLDATKILELPLPRPHYEIFIYSSRVEAIHLRGGKVARGGIRWSDRHEDYRSEILSLMKAQMVKNAVIVPEGAKGGFICKRLLPSWTQEDRQREAIECYKIMIQGLLALTDNFVGGKILKPQNVLCLDDHDYYLVVAADKGTATFSDIANQLSLEAGFWLGDAFASGGSSGYDHKKIGITARGAWESVQRHFREMSVNIKFTPFTVIGVGDMSGDVFGNGMLQSSHIKLVAAFNHMHIFIDPNPDPKTSFQERQRLFNLARSTWADYNPKSISSGGGVFTRDAKHINLSPEMKKLFGVSHSQVTPTNLIKMIFCLPVDLLFFGGIGTFIKNTLETNMDVSDRTNDEIRVTGKQVRAKVIAEGANLGMTQRGRIEYAQNGGRLNTDAIDNSAGVDCSDHEVNLKILFKQVMDTGQLTLSDRNKLLINMTEDVARLVLRDNYLQTQAISMTIARGPRALDHHIAFIKRLENDGLLNRHVEFLPNDAELDDHLKAGENFTRPELAVLLAYGKIYLHKALCHSTLLEDPSLNKLLYAYFPNVIQEKFAHFIDHHPLKREIIATLVSNDIVNRMGMAFISNVHERTDAPIAHIIHAYLSAVRLFDIETLWAQIEALDNQVLPDVQQEMFITIARFLEQIVFWLLHNEAFHLDIDELTQRYTPAVHTVTTHGTQLVQGYRGTTIRRQTKRFLDQKSTEKLAHRLGLLGVLSSALPIAHLTKDAKLVLLTVAEIFFIVGEKFQLDYLKKSARDVHLTNHWETRALGVVLDDLDNLQSAITRSILHTTPHSLSAWETHHKEEIRRVMSMLTDVKRTREPSLLMLTVVIKQLEQLC